MPRMETGFPAPILFMLSDLPPPPPKDSFGD